MRIGVDLGGTKIEGILLAPNGGVIEKIRVDTPAEKYSDTVEALCQVVEELQQKAPLAAMYGWNWDSWRFIYKE